MLRFVEMQSSLLKRQVQGSALEYCPAVKYARTVQYVQQQVELQGHQLMSTRSPAGNPQPAANATVAATAAVSTVQQSAATSSTTSRHIVDRVRSGSLTCTQSLTSPRRLTPYPDPPSCSADSVNGPETPASSALDDDEDALKLMELLKLVQQHKEELEQSGEPAVLVRPNNNTQWAPTVVSFLSDNAADTCGWVCWTAWLVTWYCTLQQQVAGIRAFGMHIAVGQSVLVF